MSEAEQTIKILPEVLTLPSGGRVWFKDLESLTGADYKRLRAAGFSDDPSRIYEVGAAVLVDRWEIPGLPNLPHPDSAEGKDGAVTSMLNWRDHRKLEQAMVPAILHMKHDRNTGDPQPPAA